MWIGFYILRLRGIDQPQQFVDFEVFRSGVQQSLESCCCFRKSIFVIECYRLLKFTVQLPRLCDSGNCQSELQQNEPTKMPEPLPHNLRMLSLHRSELSVPLTQKRRFCRS